MPTGAELATVLRACGPRAQRGVALLLVLWAVALLAILLGGFLIVARTEVLQSRFLFDATRARYAAEAGIARAAYEMRRADPLTRWVSDGRPYEVEFDGAKVELSVVDESGKIDLNAADEPLLLQFFLSLGVEEPRARSLVDSIMDWRDPDDLVRANGAEDREYEAAGLAYAPTNIGFQTAAEVQQVLGMDYELFEKMEPHVTVYARNPRPNPAVASPLVLQAMTGMMPEAAADLVQRRWQLDPQQLAATPLILPDGTPLVAAGGGVTYTVQAKATLPNGTWTLLDATIRLGGQPGGRAYSILRWREGSAE
jgi:general secretion pathway protein K